MRLLYLFLFQILFVQTLWAQIELEIIQPPVVKNDQVLDLALAGGINSAQYQTMDIDGDDDLDLAVFDRSSDKVNCFENTGGKYVYQPYFELLFPENIQHWMVLVDYDCDGKKDLFTDAGIGIRVFKNTISGGLLSWKLVAEPLKTLGSSSLINLFFNPTDIPSITDLDGDGDLDILVFDFAGSSEIEFHKNYSMENAGRCDLDFVRETRSYGGIMDCLCDNFTVNDPCGSAGRILHAGGKALLSLDYNLDGLMDIVLSQESCENLSYSQNIGTKSNVAFEPFDNAFPLFTSNLAFNSFPAASFEDVTFDGVNDLVVSSNLRSNSTLDIDFKSSSLLFENNGNHSANGFSGSVPFLQDRMIDVGEFAYPAIVDLNNDGYNDLIIGNSGSILNGEYLSSLSYYKSNGNQLEWQTDDLYNLSTLGFSEIKPQFIDMNGDGKTDLVFSALDATRTSRLFYLLNQNQSLSDLNIAQLQFMDVGIRRLDDYTFDFVDDDNLPDLLMGLSSGRLDLYANIGTASNPMFSLSTEGYLGIDGESNLSVAIGDIDGDQLSDLITTDRSGKLTIYSNYQSSSALAQESILKSNHSDVLVSTRLGRISKPTTGELIGRQVIAVGSIQGGIRLMATSANTETGQLIIKAFPVPTLQDRVVNFQSNLSNTKLEIFSLAGHKVGEIELAAYISKSIDLGYLEDGLYLAKGTSGGQSCTIKIIVSPFN